MGPPGAGGALGGAGGALGGAGGALGGAGCANDAVETESAAATSNA